MRRASGKVLYTADQYHHIVRTYETSEVDWNMVQLRNSLEYGCSCSSTGSNIVYPQKADRNNNNMNNLGVILKNYSEVNHRRCFFDQLPMTLQLEITKTISRKRNFFPQLDIVDALCNKTETWKNNAEENPAWKESEDKMAIPTVVRVWDENRERNNNNKCTISDAVTLAGDDASFMEGGYDNDEYSYDGKSHRRRCITVPSVPNKIRNRSPKRRMTVSSDQRIIYGMGKHFERMYSSSDSLTNEFDSLRTGSRVFEQEVDDAMTDEDIFITEEGTETCPSTIVSLISSYVTFGLLKLYDALPLRSKHCRSG